MRTVLIVSSIMAGGCGEAGSGIFASEVREVEGFFGVENRSEANLSLSVTSSAVAAPVELTVSGDDNLIAEVRTWVTEGTLVIHTERALDPDIELQVVATVPALTLVDSSGSGDVYATGVAGELLEVISSGSGAVTVSADSAEIRLRSSGSGETQLSGTTANLDLSSSGSGDAQARGLSAATGVVSSSGSGDVEVCVTGELRAYASGSGDIDYYCNPDVVHDSSSGSGSVVGH